MIKQTVCFITFLGACASEPPRPKDNLREWLEVCADHGYTQAEMAMATGREAPEIARRLQEYGIKLEGRPAPKPFTILPYPGGRHPRIGFLDGALEPHRDTKFSLFLPGGGYAVIDFPEAVWREKDLIYLAHRHIPTYWEKKGVTLPHLEWSRAAGGVLESRRVLPDGVEFFARVRPAPDGAEMELRLKNGSDQALKKPRAQVCVLLKGAPGFNAQTRENKLKLEAEGVCAVRSEDGRRWIATVFERPRVWENPPCPCIHSDPSWPDLAPGEEAVARGRVFYFEGDDLRAEIGRRAVAGTLIPQS
jgi:hypothetical protein